MSKMFFMKTLNFILSNTLRLCLIFLLYFIWFRYFLDSLVWSVVLTAFLTLATDLVLRIITKRKNVKVNLKKEELARAEGFSNGFIFNTKTASLNFYYELLSENFKTIKKSEYIVFEKENKKFILFPYYKYNNLTVEDIIYVFNKVKQTNCDEVFLCVNEVDEMSLKIMSKLPIKITILDKYDSYEKLMKTYNKFPNTLFNFQTNPKLTFKGFLSLSLNKKRAGGYIFASFILLLSSLFVKITIYYLIMSSILLILSIFSYTNSIFNKKLPKNLF